MIDLFDVSDNKQNESIHQACCKAISHHMIHIYTHKMINGERWEWGEGGNGEEKKRKEKERDSENIKLRFN